METLRYVLLANGLLVVVSVAYYGLLRRETFFAANRLALWLGVVAALVLPLLTLPDWRPQRVKNVMYKTAQVIVPRVLPGPNSPRAEVTITMPNGKTYPAFAGQIPATVGWSWQRLAVSIYVLIALALLIRFVVQLLSLRRLIARSVHEPYADFVLVNNPTVTSPFSFFRWVVLNPDNHLPDELEQILRHERVHVRARHSLDMLGAEVLSIVLWFNPALYLFRHLLHQTLEFAADRAVLNEGIDARSYQYNLVKVSLGGGRMLIGNSFGSSDLRQRIGMMNRRGSGLSVWTRYVLWAGMLGLMGLACRHKQPPGDEHITFSRTPPKISPTNATRTLAAKLDAQPAIWFRAAAMIEDLPQSVVINGQKTTSFMFNGYPTILSVLDGKMRLFKVEDSQVQVFINGQASTIEMLENTPFAQVNDLFIYQKEETARSGNPDEQYQILVGTTHKMTNSPIKEQWELHLKANAVSGSIYGESHTFSMNQLLEATFFHNKHVLVERTKDNYLFLPDTYQNNTDTYINGIPVKPEAIKTIHVREVDKVYTRERKFAEWSAETNPEKRYIIYIKTAPNRAKRDSTYYVFSPFYSGDF